MGSKLMEETVVADRRPSMTKDASLTLEAMRLGVVPQTELEAYTVGRRPEMEVVQRDLERAKGEGAVRAFLGTYGSGKTHLLELVGQQARAQGFVTAQVVLNPDETAPSHPKRVYRELIRSLVYPDDKIASGGSVEPIIEKVAADREACERFGVHRREVARNCLDEGAHLYWTPVLRYYRALAMGEKNEGRRLRKGEIDAEARDEALRLLFHWVEGSPTISNQDIDDRLRKVVGRQDRVYSLKDYRPWARIYGYLLSGLAALVQEAGYAGLVVLVDEAEFYSLLSSENRDYAQILFKALAWASVGERDGEGPVSRQELDVGGMGILKKLPPRYGSGGLYTVFAMTPNEEGVEALRGAVKEEEMWELGRLAMGDYQELVGAVTRHVREARPEQDFDRRLEGALAKIVAGLLEAGYVENPRQAMKFVVEFLDLATFRPGAMPEVIADLRAIYG